MHQSGSETLSCNRPMLSSCGKFVLFDIHPYNHRRDGPNQAPADPALNPEINIGTSSMDELTWRLLVNRFIADLQNFHHEGRILDVRENIRFQGNQIPSW